MCGSSSTRIRLAFAIVAGSLLPGGALAASDEAWVAFHAETGNSVDVPKAIAVGTDSGVYVTGVSSGGYDSQADIVTVRLDAAGNIVWTARYAGPGRPLLERDEPCGIALGAGGKVHVAGTSMGDGTRSDIVLVTYDSAGNELWAVRWDAAGGPDEAAGMAVDAAGNVIVAGTSWGEAADGMDDMVTLKVSPDGTILWTARYGGICVTDDGSLDPDEVVDPAVGIGLDAAGDIYAFAGNLREPVCLGCDTEPASVTVKYDPDGSQLWDSWIGSSSQTRMAVDAAGSEYIAGLGYYEDPFLFVRKIRPDGGEEEDWAEPSGIEADYPGPIAVDGAGGVIATGVLEGDGGNRIGVVQYDSDGSVAWTAEVGGIPPLDTYVGGFSIVLAVDPSRGAIVACEAGSDTIILKLGPSGEEVWRTAYPGTGTGLIDPGAMVLDGSGILHLTCASALSGEDFDYAVLTLDASGKVLRESRWGGQAGGSEIATTVLTDDSGNVYVGGSSWAADTLGDLAVVKYDPEGNRLWSARHDNAMKADGKYGRTAMALDGTGGVCATGYSGESEAAEIVTVRWDAGGSRLWAAAYPVGFDNSVDPPVIAFDRSGNVLVLGHVCFGGLGEMVTLKYGPDGALLWQATEESRTMGTGMAVDDQGNVYVTGTLYEHDNELYAMKYDPDGNRLWASYHDGSRGWKIFVDVSGVLVLGNYGMIAVKYDAEGRQLWTNSIPKLDGKSLLFRAFALDGAGNTIAVGSEERGGSIITMKLDPRGNLVWRARREGEGWWSTARGVAVDRAGCIYVTGDLSYSGPIATIKYGPRGAELWTRVYDGSPGSANASGIAIDPAGDIIVAGSAATSAGGMDFVTIKYKAPPPVPFIRGDCDGDGLATGSVTDALILLDHLFMGGTEPPCLEACDANGDGEVLGQVTDAIYMLWHSFLGGPAPPPPFPDCGTAEELIGCAESPACRA